jgi:hypothetical protein
MTFADITAWPWHAVAAGISFMLSGLVLWWVLHELPAKEVEILLGIHLGVLASFLLVQLWLTMRHTPPDTTDTNSYGHTIVPVISHCMNGISFGSTMVSLILSSQISAAWLLFFQLMNALVDLVLHDVTWAVAPMRLVRSHQLVVEKPKVEEIVSEAVGGVCPICLSSLEAGDSLGKLPCQHDFHLQCINTWLRTGTCCPMRCPV